MVVQAQQVAPDPGVAPLGEALRDEHDRRAEPARQQRPLQAQESHQPRRVAVQSG